MCLAFGCCRASYHRLQGADWPRQGRLHLRRPAGALRLSALIYRRYHGVPHCELASTHGCPTRASAMSSLCHACDLQNACLPFRFPSSVSSAGQHDEVGPLPLARLCSPAHRARSAGACNCGERVQFTLLCVHPSCGVQLHMSIAAQFGSHFSLLCPASRHAALPVYGPLRLS